MNPHFSCQKVRVDKNGTSFQTEIHSVENNGNKGGFCVEFQ